AKAHTGQLWRFFAWAGVVAVPFVGFHVAVFGSPLPWYYRQSSGKFHMDMSFVEAAAGTLISPGRGLFLYSPIFFFSIVGAALLVRQKRWRLLESCLAAILVLHWLVISSWKIWWGGTVFGPRLFADMVPFLLFFLLPVLERLAVPGGRRLALAAGLAASIAVSAFIHRSGAVYWATWDWNVEPVSVDEHPERLWHWSDPPFLRRDDASRR
ncbi:MAG: hypothetical protein AAFX50_20360, partial [Acidobacteriota bacterium]